MIYFDPKAYVLESLGEVDWIGGAYEFDLTAVWRSTIDSDLLFWADDSGCSCPCPFEDFTMDKLSRGSMHDLFNHLDVRLETGYVAASAAQSVAEIKERVLRIYYG